MKIVSHRGARGLAPENTLASVQRALDCGVDEIEIDLRVTSDGHVILAHDAVLREPGKSAFVIADRTFAELQAYKSDIATFSEAVRLVDRKVPLMVEVKPRVDTAPIIAMLEGFLADGWQPEDFMLGSFSQRTLLALHDALPQIESVIIERLTAFFAMRRARQVNTRKISLNHHLMWTGTIIATRRRQYELYAYTLNTPVKAKRWARHGLAGVITDRPDLYTTK